MNNDQTEEITTSEESTMREVWTADGRKVTEGARVFNYYDGKWGTITELDDQGWFFHVPEDGSRGACLNGERVAVVVPRNNPFYGVWEAGR